MSEEMHINNDIFRRKLVRLVLPIAFQQFMLAIVSASDALMLGKSRTGIAGGGITSGTGDLCAEPVSGSDDDRNQYVCGAVLGKRRQAVRRKSICLCVKGNDDRLCAVWGCGTDDSGSSDEDLYQ